MSELKTISVTSADEVSSSATVLCVDGTDDSGNPNVVQTPMKNIKGSSTGGCVIVPCYKFNDSTDGLYNMCNLYNSSGEVYSIKYYIIKDSEWGMILKGYPINVIVSCSSSVVVYGTAIYVAATPGMLNTSNNQGEPCNAQCSYIISSSLSSTTTMSTFYITSASLFKEFLLNTTYGYSSAYEGGNDAAIAKLEELGYFDVE